MTPSPDIRWQQRLQNFERALALLREHRDQLDRLASTLLARETLAEAEAYAVAGVAGVTSVTER